MAKRRTIVYLSEETALALGEYQRRHRDRLPSGSATIEHLLRRALTADLDEGVEGLLLPAIARAVRAAVRQEVGERVGEQIARQSHRLAGLLVASDKDAHRAAELGRAVLERQVGQGPAGEIARDVELRAGARYSRQGLRDAAD